MQTSSFAPRVSVYSPEGALLYSVHPERAAQLVTEPEQIRKRKGGKVREITVSTVRHETSRPSQPPRLNQYMGQKYTYTEPTKNLSGEIDGRVCQFKYIHPGDRAIFCLSVTDCLTA